MLSLDVRRRLTKKVMPILGLLATAGVLGATSCSGSKATQPLSERAALAEGDGSASELRERWEQWLKLGLRSYGFEFRRTCFCTRDYVTPAWVEVRDGRVISARAVIGVGPSILSGWPLPRELFEPVDSLFADAIREAESGGRVVVSYDPSLGYPAVLTIGMPEADAGVTYTVPRLVPR